MNQTAPMTDLHKLLEHMWSDYCQMNPEAQRIVNVLTAAGEKVLNDHIALRTFNLPGIGIHDLAKHFTKYGYKEAGEYHFKEKKLFAKHWQHEDLSLPKVFISELLVEEMPTSAQAIIHQAVKELPINQVNNFDFLYSGRPWNMSYKNFQELAAISEYAAWLCAWGFRPNHFTVIINELKKLNEITVLNSFLKENGFKLNSFGGEIKGTPAEMLEQSSTMAAQIPVQFSDGTFSVPGCYYEFAKRYKDQSGQLYHGFIAKSADKIFESTHRQ